MELWREWLHGFLEREGILSQANSALGIGSSIVNSQPGSLNGKLEGSPHALVRLCCRDFPLLIEEHDLVLLADGTDEMHFTRRKRQFRRRSKTGWQITSGADRMHFQGGAALQSRMVSAVTISGKEER